jgi:hypothetical protein
MRISVHRTAGLTRTVATAARTTARTTVPRGTAAALAMVTVTGVVGAVSPAITARASGNPLAGLTADQIASKAIANLKAASSVYLTGSGKYAGQAFTFNMSLTPKGCDGTVALPPTKGTFVLLVVGKSVWIRPSNQFWESEGVPSAELSQVSGKYVAVTGSAAKQISGIDVLCTPKDFADNFGGAVTGLVTAGTSVIGGQPAVEVKDRADSAFMDVSISAKPEVLRIDAPGTANFSFSHYGARVTLNPPPPGEVIAVPGA